jgi:cytochrome c-type biogenesis protein CcmH
MTRAWLAPVLAIVLAALLPAAPARAQVAAAQAPIEFRDAAEEHRFRTLTAQLRCVMCQNQSLADSDAMIARDLRAQILRMMREGRSDEQIEDFLVERYSEFVLYEPRVGPATWLLWFGPGVLLLAGIGVIVAVVRRRAGAVPAAAPADDEQEW